MTLSVFPTLPGLTYTVLKTPEFNTLDSRAPNAYETRIAQTINPTWMYTLIYDFLHDFAWSGFSTVSELRTMMGFFCQMGGKAGSFLFTDPDDCYVGPAITGGITPLLLALFENGIFQIPGGIDFSIAGTAITFSTAPTVGDNIYSAGLTNTCTGQILLAQVPTGTINGVNTVFTLSGTPVMVMVFRGGLFQTPGGVDYTLTGNTITFVTAPIAGTALYTIGLATGSAAAPTGAVPAGTVNGVNTVFALGTVPDVLLVYNNGIYQTPMIDYTQTGAIFDFAIAPSIGDALYIAGARGTGIISFYATPAGLVNGSNTLFSLGSFSNIPLAQLVLVTDGSGNFYSPIQRTLNGVFYEDVTDLNGGIAVYTNGVLASAGTGAGQYTVLGPGLALPGASYMGVYLKWGPGTPPMPPITAQFYFYFRVRFDTDSQDFEKFMNSGTNAASSIAGRGGGIWTIGGSESMNGSGMLKLTTARPTPL